MLESWFTSEFIPEPSPSDLTYITRPREAVSVLADFCKCTLIREKKSKKFTLVILPLRWELRLSPRVTPFASRKSPSFLKRWFSRNRLFRSPLSQRPKLTRKEWVWL